MKSAHLKAVPASVVEIPLQNASMDIWDTKYRLKKKDGTPVDEDIDATYRRVAKALADTEATPELQQEWAEHFLWALRHGAIPAGRIISNAGARTHKPATSTINCTVSGIIHDSMSEILGKVHEAGLTLKAGCGIGYEFSTLRPRGAYVSGAGAYTSGPLSFMDIYDKMCFTVSSAGGRRGAQMATFDVGHPDVMDFIRAKREDGRLRQFNLSLLVTEEFMEAVRNDHKWDLAFPITAKEIEEDGLDPANPEQIVWRDWPHREGYTADERGRVACKIYKTIRACRLWDVIMSSTYDYAEPGFILIDKVNEMNNNWFCENVRATNPCVTADTWVQTTAGPRQVRELVGTPFKALVDGRGHVSGPEGFFRTATKAVVNLVTTEGHRLRLTADHRIRRVTRFTRYTTETEWCEAGRLRTGDQVLLNDHRSAVSWEGRYTREQGYLLGLLVGDGTLKADKAVLSVWKQAAISNGADAALPSGVEAIMHEALQAAQRAREIITPCFGTPIHPVWLRCENLKDNEYSCVSAPCQTGASTPQIQGLIISRALSQPHRADFLGWHEIAGRNEYRLSLGALKGLAEEVGMRPGDKAITPALERASSDFYRGFLRGLFDADGSVQGSQAKGVSIRLVQSDLPRLEAVQRMLLRLGMNSQIYQDRRHRGHATLPDGRGGSALYATQPQHELVISGENLLQFESLVGFADSDKALRLKESLAAYQRRLNRERFVARVNSVVEAGTEAVYDVQVPGINTFDANGLHAHNCGEQPLPPYGACLLGSINLTRFVRNPFTADASFDWDEFRKVITIFTRMLDNVVEVNGLPLENQRQEIMRKRRHGMGYLGLGSTITMLRMKYGDAQSLEFTERVTRELALEGWRAGLELSREKGPAPIMEEEFTITSEMLAQRPEMAVDDWKPGDRIKGKVLHAKYSRYMQQVAREEPELVAALAESGCRFTHHSSIAPTGTISLSLANNASNGIEPSFAHHYSRNLIRQGRKSKEKIDVYSFELLAYRGLIDARAMPYSEATEEQLPDYFISADDVLPKQHVDVQAAAQKWIDSSISKTANIPTDYPYEDFKGIYLYAYEKGLKGCTTFRFNPEAFQGVLVKEQDLENTTYRFTLEDGTEVEAKGNDEIEYDGEVHTAANLFDALKEGYYGKL